ncbi:hypothetical protein F0562_005741 [Nyssa sinensis]|uniref:non-specific serine/threonine protein kinase n=1 Tax=Nyssa sinensis TaxID=561372 RepID=A0A5J5AMN1_9ASTE|nr:hypothetical protein F0562_005741 [Nyssa sinensis]
MQSDGHLVQYLVNTPDTATYSYWASGTAGVGENVTLNFADDGLLYLLNSNVSVKNISRGGFPKDGRINLMKIDMDVARVLIYRNHVWAYKKISENGNVELCEEVAPRLFTYAELEQVTNGFKEDVDKGAFGIVYKGTIPKNQKVVAMKRLEKVLVEGEREFQTEMKVIEKTHHHNLVRLLGYCLDGPNRLLVYEYMSNGSLADILLTADNQPSWDEGVRIARDIARGILYLHEECETQIIHCDIKPQNIPLDECRCAKISDFELSKLLKQDQNNTFIGIRGTRSYVAPEWHRKLLVTVKADI